MTTPKKHAKVRVKATGEVGRLAQRGLAPYHHMDTHMGLNTPLVMVYFEETGEFKAFNKAKLEELED